MYTHSPSPTTPHLHTPHAHPRHHTALTTEFCHLTHMELSTDSGCRALLPPCSQSAGLAPAVLRRDKYVHKRVRALWQLPYHQPLNTALRSSSAVHCPCHTWAFAHSHTHTVTLPTHHLSSLPSPPLHSHPSHPNLFTPTPPTSSINTLTALAGEYASRLFSDLSP